MKIYSEESRVFYSDAFEHPLAITTLGHTSLHNLHVQPLLRAAALEDREREARRAVRLAAWLAQTGNFWPPVVAMGPMGPFPFPASFPWLDLLSPAQALEVAVEAAGAGRSEIARVVEDAVRRRGRLRRFHIEAIFETADVDDLEEELRKLSVPVACSPLRDITLGQVFDSLRSLHLCRRLVPGAVFTAAGVQTVRSFFEGDIMMALSFAISGTVATMILHAARPAETFSNVISRELELTGGVEGDSPRPALPDGGGEAAEA